MIRNSLSSLTAFALAAALAGCAPNDNGSGSPDAAGPRVASLEITPARVTLDVVDGAPVTQTFTVTARLDDGSISDVSATASLALDNILLGQIQAATFTTSGVAAGAGEITATYQGVSTSAQIMVQMYSREVFEPAPGNASDIFAAAAEDAARAPLVVYPADQSLVPANLGEYEVHWTDPVGNDLFEVRVTSLYLDLRTYVAGTPDGGSFVMLSAPVWEIIRNTHRGQSITITVRGLASAAPETAGTSSSLLT